MQMPILIPIIAKINEFTVNLTKAENESYSNLDNCRETRTTIKS